MENKNSFELINLKNELPYKEFTGLSNIWGAATNSLAYFDQGINEKENSFKLINLDMSCIISNKRIYDID